MKNAAKRVFSCKNRCRYSRKRATFCRNFANRRSLTSGRSTTRRADDLLPEAAPSPRPPRRAAWAHREARACGKRLVMLSCHGIRQTLEGSFSAVSKPNFASKYAFESSRRDLHNALLCTAPKSHFFKKLVEFARICENFQKVCEIRKFSNQFFAKNLRLQRCKRMQIL